MIGYSLSLCVLDILDGKVNILDVDKIIAATDARDEYDWERLLDGYCQTYWHSNPKLAREIANSLTVEQPRIRNQPHPGLGKGIWSS